MIRIRKIKDAEDQRLYAGSIYKSLADYVAGNPLKITVDPNMSLNDISRALFGLAEIMASGHDVTKDAMGDDEYEIDPDDPADFWKKGQ